MNEIRLRPATPADKPTIASLVQLYLYDMTEFMPFPVGPDGLFEYCYLDRFWRSPYLIMSGDEIAGFALVVDECPLTSRAPCWFTAEFFVLKAYRKRGVGLAALELALKAHPGDWHIAVPHANLAAQGFWGRALASRTSSLRDIHFDGDDWALYAFGSD
ncbi:Predicted acetyltransferase [Devosia lucknowensis]|uniref:Predicted acetyltransferase n=1 Tax=Devosia lucknowensis TaxID=1096929 RepID=A0A1Y6EFZ5_9HYPH|nr:GNAT family N-acetyltransferase [Devosia lucknowensis]SMQ61524.1 Predicted acetyltransferase [Devosia lucknowensis]